MVFFDSVRLVLYSLGFLFGTRGSSENLTLKHTHKENGSVTATSPQEIAVRIQPQRPIPLSDSSAENSKTYKLLHWHGKLFKWIEKTIIEFIQISVQFYFVKVEQILFDFISKMVLISFYVVAN